MGRLHAQPGAQPPQAPQHTPRLLFPATPATLQPQCKRYHHLLAQGAPFTVECVLAWVASKTVWQAKNNNSDMCTKIHPPATEESDPCGISFVTPIMGHWLTELGLRFGLSNRNGRCTFPTITPQLPLSDICPPPPPPDRIWDPKINYRHSARQKMCHGLCTQHRSVFQDLAGVSEPTLLFAHHVLIREAPV